uniref:Uncharacterized protein n=1 Tax=Anopheles atroparvus TaxID=41427 RepID=A0A182IYG1_ANOAO
MNNSYEYGATMECRENGVLRGAIKHPNRVFGTPPWVVMFAKVQSARCAYGNLREQRDSGGKTRFRAWLREMLSMYGGALCTFLCWSEVERFGKGSNGRKTSAVRPKQELQRRRLQANTLPGRVKSCASPVGLTYAPLETRTKPFRAAMDIRKNHKFRHAITLPHDPDSLSPFLGKANSSFRVAGAPRQQLNLGLRPLDLFPGPDLEEKNPNAVELWSSLELAPRSLLRLHFITVANS